MNERPVTVSAKAAPKLRNEVRCETHTFVADEPEDLGGTNEGPMPFEILVAALGACTNMTMRLYAERKGYSLEGSDVVLTQSVSGTDRNVERVITLHGPLEDEARQKLVEIANKCPVHRALEGSKIKVTTRLG